MTLNHDIAPVIINGRVDATGMIAFLDSIRRAATVLHSETDFDCLTQFWDIGDAGQLATAVLADDGLVVLEPTKTVAGALAAILAVKPEIDVRVVHGWPILSLAGDTPAIAGGEGIANLSVGDMPLEARVA